VTSCDIIWGVAAAFALPRQHCAGSVTCHFWVGFVCLSQPPRCVSRWWGYSPRLVASSRSGELLGSWLRAVYGLVLCILLSGQPQSALNQQLMGLLCRLHRLFSFLMHYFAISMFRQIETAVMHVLLYAS